LPGRRALPLWRRFERRAFGFSLEFSDSPD
jgi:hypothetical protein